ncbi:hemagglutinin [Parathermosynechococcus lividus]
MSEPITASEAKQIMDLLQSMDKKLDVHIARTDEQFKTVRAEINGVRTELKGEISAVRTELKSEINALRTELKADIKVLDDKVEALRSELREDIAELRSQQKTTDARLWAFIVGLVTLVGGSVIKVLWFDRA